MLVILMIGMRLDTLTTVLIYNFFYFCRMQASWHLAFVVVAFFLTSGESAFN